MRVEKGWFKRICVALYVSAKILIKRQFCKHKYIWKATISGRNIELDKRIVFSYTYECSKCGKELDVDMDEKYQETINYEYQ